MATLVPASHIWRDSARTWRRTWYVVPAFTAPLHHEDGIELVHMRHADVYHTYLSLAALALSDDVSPLSSAPDESSRLRRLDPAWNVSVEVVERMRKALHRRS